MYKRICLWIGFTVALGIFLLLFTVIINKYIICNLYNNMCNYINVYTSNRRVGR